MYVHFQDWTYPALLESLSDKGIPHGDRIIKVFASDEDPRTSLGRAALTVLDSDSRPFSGGEVYAYPDRRDFSGDELEEELASKNFGDVGTRTVRALFRFSNQYGFCQASMAAKFAGAWVMEHPFQHIDGMKIAARLPRRERTIHLDIFTPRSLGVLKGIVDYDDPKRVLDMDRGGNFILSSQ